MSFFVERAPSGAQSSSVSVPLRSAQSRCPPDTLRRLSLLCNHCNPLIDKRLQFFYFMHILELQGHGWSRHGNTQIVQIQQVLFLYLCLFYNFSGLHQVSCLICQLLIQYFHCCYSVNLYSESGEYISQIVNTWSIKAFISPVMGDMRRTDKQWIFI